MKKLPALLLFFHILAFLGAQETDTIPETSDLDSLFEEDLYIEDPVEKPVNETTDEEALITEAEQEEPETSLLDDIKAKSPFDIHGSILLLAGISAGFGKFPEDPEADNPEYGDWEYSDMGVLKMNSSLSINARIAPDFRLYQKYTFSYPDFDLDVAELFVDYTFYDILFFRIGRYHENWGRSRIFPFTNLPNRLAGAYNEDPDSIAARVQYPIGAGGLTLISFNRNSFFEDPDAPELSELGLGGTFNAVFYGIDLTVGMFYQKDLQYRFFYSAGTTLFGKLEFYTEGLVSHFEVLEDGDFNHYKQEFAVNAGGFITFFNNKLQLNGEYYYNGENRNLLMKNRTAPLQEVPLITGHNLSAGFRWKLFGNKASVYAQWLYNIDEDTGLIVPGIDVTTFPYLVISLKMPVIYGEPEGTYWQYNPDPQGRRILAALTVQLKGTF